MSKHAVLIIFIVSIFLGSCKPDVVVAPTSTPTVMVPSQTSTITSTPTLKPTQTPTPTHEATATATKRTLVIPEFSEQITVPAGGFQFMKPLLYPIQIEGQQVLLADSEGTFLATLIGGRLDPTRESARDFVQNFVKSFFGTSPNAFMLEEEQPTSIAGIEGWSCHVISETNEIKVEGDILMVTPFGDQYFFVMALSKVSDDEDTWQTEGQAIMNALLATVEFPQPLAQQSGLGCPISDDPTYGYKEENPIRSGGDWMSGPSRERAYLDNLRGPNGEPVTYERMGSFEFDDTILDQFVVMFAGKQVILFLDEYSFTTPIAPVGFTCLAEFPLSAP